MGYVGMFASDLIIELPAFSSPSASLEDFA